MKGKMKALVKEEAGPGAVIRTVDIPEPGPHDVLVKVIAASVCGTDLHIFNWDQWAASRIKPPVIIGHEMAGEIVEIGSAVQNCRPGDYVSLECHQTCGKCFQCRTGRAHICQDYSILGIDFNGCFAEFVRVPETNIWKNSASIPPEIATLQDPMGNAVLTTLSGEITGKTVLITGCGPIGLLSTGIARASGAAKIYAVDINDYRLGIARRMGATATINPHRVKVADEVLAQTGGNGVDVVLEVSGSEQCLRDGLKLVKNGGRVALLGIYDRQVRLDLSGEIVFKGITLAGITGRKIFETWYLTSALLNGLVDITPVITHRMKLEDYAEAFALMNLRDCGKIILYP